VRRADLGSSHDLYLWCQLRDRTQKVLIRVSESRENGVVPEDTTFLIPRY
jgi:hypothetical protein